VRKIDLFDMSTSNGMSSGYKRNMNERDKMSNVNPFTFVMEGNGEDVESEIKEVNY
jgi:hypothetical protein